MPLWLMTGRLIPGGGLERENWRGVAVVAFNFVAVKPLLSAGACFCSLT